jgi:outer membrane protein insertion porin family
VLVRDVRFSIMQIRFLTLLRAGLVGLLALALSSALPSAARAQTDSVSDAAATRAGDAGTSALLPAPDAPTTPAGAAPTSETRVDGLSIRAIRFESNDSIGATAEPTLRSVKVGDIYRTELAREIVREVMATGGYATADVQGAQDGAFIDLTVVTTPRRLIEEFVIVQGELAFTREEILREAELQRDGELVMASVQAAETRLTAFCVKRGYVHARATIEVASGKSALHRVLTVRLEGGKVTNIRKRVFEANDATPEMREVYSSYARTDGAAANEDALNAADAELQQRVRARGYHDAAVTHALQPQGDAVDLRIKVNLGDRYELTFLGADHYDTPTLLAMLNLDTETDRSAAHLGDKIRAFYIDRGFLDCEVGSVETQVPGRRTLTFRVLERERVRVAARRFPCFRHGSLAASAHDSAPVSEDAIGNEIDSFLEEDLPGAGFVRNVDSRNVDAMLRGPNAPLGTRPTALELNANRVYAPRVYETAIAHLQELYRADGYLSATVGPLSVRRRSCQRGSPPGECIPIEVAPLPDQCTYDASGLPTIDLVRREQRGCSPSDGSNRQCEPDVHLSLPIRLGPRTMLRDVAFTGVTVAR